jgi:hypothetical protein
VTAYQGWSMCFRLLAVALGSHERTACRRRAARDGQGSAHGAPRSHLRCRLRTSGRGDAARIPRPRIRGGQEYREGKNIVIESRWAEGRYDQLPALAGELFRLQPDVNVTSGPGTRIVMPDTPRREACPGAAADSSADWSIVLAEVVALGDAAVVPPVQTAPLQHRHHQIHELLDRAR